ncbi:hypothetical protein HDU97_007783 [Phlyctochytrium planicorne]|nr:hypothetical protein HDU97_007783 [Phlyctochytrium planicorne]
MKREGEVYSDAHGQVVATNRSQRRQHMEQAVKFVMPAGTERKDMNAILKLGTASKNAFDYRLSMLRSQKMELEYNIQILNNTYFYGCRKEQCYEQQLRLVVEALKSRDLKVRPLPRDATKHDKFSHNDLSKELTVDTYGYWKRSLKSALAQAGCSAETWETLTQEDFKILESHQQKLEELLAASSLFQNDHLMATSEFFDPYVLKPSQIFASEGEARKREQRERKKMESKSKKMGSCCRRGGFTGDASDVKTVLKMKGDARELLQIC